MSLSPVHKSVTVLVLVVVTFVVHEYRDRKRDEQGGPRNGQARTMPMSVVPVLGIRG